jgi:hypothetical protein
LPIILEAEIILKLWLKIVPDYTVIFTRLVIINILVDSISGPLMTAAQASGKIKIYQGIVGSIIIFNLPVSYIFLKMGYSPQITLYVSISISLIALYARLIIISPLVKLNIFKYIQEVILRIIPVTIIAIIIPIILITNLQGGIYRIVISVFSSILSVVITIYFVGLKKSEQFFIKMKFKQVLKRYVF